MIIHRQKIARHPEGRGVPRLWMLSPDEAAAAAARTGNPERALDAYAEAVGPERAADARHVLAVRHGCPSLVATAAIDDPEMEGV